MAGQKFQYDESGNTFIYFVLSFLALILLPCTYYFWPSSKVKTVRRRDINCNCEPCLAKEGVLKQKEPAKKMKRFLIRLSLTLGWILFAFIAYKITQTDYEMANFDPYEILGVATSASQREIKKAYHKLSLLYHPDKETGDEKLFMKLTKAYQALTDETARKNWERYGNPDGPGAMNFGIALPSWIVDKENSIWVLGLYALVFMIALPTTVGIWWYKSIQYSGDKVLLDTTQIYYYFFHKSPEMAIQRIIMILAASLEFEKGHNSEVQERFSDNQEVAQLIKQLPKLNEKNKERPLCYAYSVKARALLHAHLTRIPLPPKTLEVDRQLVVRKCPYLIQEQVTCIAQLVMLAHAGRIPRLPALSTIEGAMKLSPMVVQALWEAKSPLMQLPHVTEDMQKYFMAKKRQIKSIKQFCEMKDEDRRSMLRNLSDDQYADVMRVCASMPLIDFHVQCEVLDDEDAGVVTAGAIVTVTVTLTRHSMGDLLKGVNNAGANYKEAEDDEAAVEGEENKENVEAKGEDGDTQPLLSAKAKPVWQKQRKGGKKSGGNKNKNIPKKPVAAAAAPTKSPKVAVQKSDLEGNNENGDDINWPQDEDKSDDEGSDGSGSDSEAPSDAAERKEKSQSSPEDDDAEWEKCQQKLAKNKERALEGKSKLSHPVHCPFYPDVKQEYWWTYVCDKKSKRLITAPYLITNLVNVEESQLKFTAPPRPGKCQFTVCLRSDSYMGFDQSFDIKLDVKEAKEIDEHPQWDISEEEEEEQEQSNESEFASDDEFDDDVEEDEDA